MHARINMQHLENTSCCEGLTRVLNIMDDSSNVADERLPLAHEPAVHKVALVQNGMHRV